MELQKKKRKNMRRIGLISAPPRCEKKQRKSKGKNRRRMGRTARGKKKEKINAERARWRWKQIAKKTPKIVKKSILSRSCGVPQKMEKKMN
jgi:hypothetical protein